MTADIFDFSEFDRYEDLCEEWKIVNRRLKELENAEKILRDRLLKKSNGERMDFGVKIQCITRAPSYDYKTACDEMLASEMLEAYIKPGTTYWKITSY